MLGSVSLDVFCPARLSGEPEGDGSRACLVRAAALSHGHSSEALFEHSGEREQDEGLDLLELEAGAIYIMDRGYLDFKRLYRVNAALAFFVTRAKSKLDFKCMKSLSVEGSAGVLSDMTIELQGVKSRTLYPQTLRRVRFKDSETKRIFVFLTNNFTLPAKAIAFLYKCRWSVEVFFRWVKRNLRIKSFFGTSPNAVKTQLWIALAAYALVISMRRQLGLKQSPGLLLQIPGVHLFEKTPLQELLTENQNGFSKSNIFNQLRLFN